MRPDFFRTDERKGKPRNARDILLGLWLMVAGAAMTVFASWEPYQALQYSALFSESTPAEMRLHLCEAMRSSTDVRKLPKIDDLPRPPYVMSFCVDGDDRSKGVGCDLHCRVVYGGACYLAKSVDEAIVTRLKFCA